MDSGSHPLSLSLSFFSLVPTSAEFEWLFFFLNAKVHRKTSLADCWDVIALTEGDSSCHGCQTARPAAYQTAGYSVTGDMLNQPLKRNCCQLYMVADSQSSRRLLHTQLDSR